MFALAEGTAKESQEILKSEVAQPSEEQGVGVRLLQDHYPRLETGELIHHHRKICLCKLTVRRCCLFSARGASACLVGMLEKSARPN